jgi:hypothetical protein
VPESNSRACCSFDICASISAIMRLTSMGRPLVVNGNQLSLTAFFQYLR